jgi:cell fate (sporulation/competence/biofilm development) regulator YlbF (YheA/YmcA/DUF963 family)
MEESKPKYIQRIIGDFEEFYFRETLKSRIEGNDSASVSFRDFINKKEYTSDKERLESQLNGSGKYDNLEQIIFENLTEDQKKRIGGLFHVGIREFFDGQTTNRKATIIDTHIAKTPEYQGFLDVKDYLKDDEKEKLATKLSKLLYSQLGDEERQVIDEGSIKRYLLNIGFIRAKRVSHRKAIDFIKEYPSLFHNEESVLSHILERYIDEDLTNTPVEDTSQRIKDLKQEVRELYRSILE